MIRDFYDALRQTKEKYPYSEEKILDDILFEIEAEDGEDFQEYEFVDSGEVVPAGTPIGVEIGDFSQGIEIELFLYENIRYGDSHG